MGKDPILNDYKVEKKADWHTIVIPLNATEDPPQQFVTDTVYAAYGHLPFAEARFEKISWTIEHNPRRLVGRFPKWANDPKPDTSQFEAVRAEEYRAAKARLVGKD